MKVKELIKILQSVEDKNRNIQILIGDEYDDSLGCEVFDVMHIDDSEQCVEIFCEINDCYTEIFPQSKITINTQQNDNL